MGLSADEDVSSRIDWVHHERGMVHPASLMPPVRPLEPHVNTLDIGLIFRNTGSMKSSAST